MKIKSYTSRLLLSLILILVMSPFSSASAAQKAVYGSVVIDGIEMEFEEKPIVINGNTMVPFRAIFEALGMEVSWDNKSKIVTGKKQGLVIELGTKMYGTINGKQYPLTQSPFLSATGTFYVNLRFISEASDASVSWNNNNKVATINSASLLKGLTKQEILDFDLLRMDWSKKQMEELGLEKKVNDLGGETKYSDDIITYTFFDFNNDTTPGVIDVHGEHPGPRGISVGETFEDVISLFPQHKDWRNNNEGIFYGKFDKYKGYPIGLTGYVHTYDNGAKELTLTTENSYPFMRIFFNNDVVTHYTFFVINATH